MATLNTAEHFGVADQVGQIAPGRFADILIVRNLPELLIDQVIALGKVVYQDGRLVPDLAAYDYPDWVRHSVHLGHRLEAADFRLTLPPDDTPAPSTVMANVIGVIENQAPTHHLRLHMSVLQDEVQADRSRDIAKLALVERHRGSGIVQIGLVNGFGFDMPCAVGTTVAHDCHHMIVAGTDEANMAQAANVLAEVGGGQVVVRQGEVIGLVELPIAGLMSTERAEVVAQKAASILEGFRACGCTLNNPNMQLSLLALAVIPELRLTDLGLVDVTRFELIPVLEA
jgi:adenine deaminase